MSTRKKYDARRVGFELDSQGRERSLGRDGEWADSIRHEARFAYLNILSREYHGVLTSLRDLPRTEDSLRQWADRWGLLRQRP
jgi:hypothetical protein